MFLRCVCAIALAGFTSLPLAAGAQPMTAPTPLPPAPPATAAPGSTTLPTPAPRGASSPVTPVPAGTVTPLAQLTQFTRGQTSIPPIIFSTAPVPHR